MADEAKLRELVAGGRQAVLAGVTRQGFPHLTNVLYVWSEEEQLARVSTTANRVKGKIFQRDPHATLHVGGPHFWSYAVAECDADTSQVATTPGDAACLELLQLHSAYGELKEEEFFDQMIEARRLVVRLRPRKFYGVTLDEPPQG